MSAKMLAITASLVTISATIAPAQAPPPPPASYAQLRQASIDMSLILRTDMNAAMRAGKDAKTQAYAAHALARWAHVLPSMFPTGSGPGETSTRTQALPSVWTDRAGFLKAAGRFAEASEKLARFADDNDTGAFSAQLVLLRQTCDACHAVYKGGMQGPPTK